MQKNSIKNKQSMTGKELLEGLNYVKQVYPILEAQVNAIEDPTCDSNSKNEELCGPLWPILTDDNVVEIEWNGPYLWVKDKKNKWYKFDRESGEMLEIIEE